MDEGLINISPIDGRYRGLTEEIRNYFSEYNLINNRIIVEIKWLQKMSELPEIDFKLSDEELDTLENIIQKFNFEEGKKIKETEKTTKHDVKAIEYYLDEKLKENGLERCCPYVHFACTSEDINNLAYGMMETGLLKIYIRNIETLIEKIQFMAHEYSDLPMLSHTHGQPATPTTVGKELANFAYRINKILNRIKQERFAGKFNGTVGNFNSHIIAYPNVEWERISQEFVEQFRIRI